MRPLALCLCLACLVGCGKSEAELQADLRAARDTLAMQEREAEAYRVKYTRDSAGAIWNKHAARLTSITATQIVEASPDRYRLGLSREERAAKVAAGEKLDAGERLAYQRDLDLTPLFTEGTPEHQEYVRERDANPHYQKQRELQDRVDRTIERIKSIRAKLNSL